MIKKAIMVVAAIGIFGCASNPNKAKKIDTKIEKASQVSGETKVGVKDGNMIVQKKVMMNEELRLLQNEVYGLEDTVYGNRKYGSMGLYGALRECKKKSSAKENGGDGKLKWTEPMDRVTDKEEEWKIGLDDKEKIIGVSEEFLLDRIKRFREYKRVLMKREDEYKEKIEICDAALEAQIHDKKSKSEATGG